MFTESEKSIVSPGPCRVFGVLEDSERFGESEHLCTRRRDLGQHLVDRTRGHAQVHGEDAAERGKTDHALPIGSARPGMSAAARRRPILDLKTSASHVLFM